MKQEILKATVLGFHGIIGFSGEAGLAVLRILANSAFPLCFSFVVIIGARFPENWGENVIPKGLIHIPTLFVHGGNNSSSGTTTLSRAGVHPKFVTAFPHPDAETGPKCTGDFRDKITDFLCAYHPNYYRFVGTTRKTSPIIPVPFLPSHATCGNICFQSLLLFQPSLVLPCIEQDKPVNNGLKNFSKIHSSNPLKQKWNSSESSNPN